ncbi:MAG: hypothetical protein IK015_05885 [Treponema sp.]|nr:hypothetical protein [Treponema sp.]
MTLAELQYKIEVGLTVEFEHGGQKYFIRGERERSRSFIYFGKEHESGAKYDTFTQFMDEAMIGNQYLREYIRSV